MWVMVVLGENVVDKNQSRGVTVVSFLSTGCTITFTRKLVEGISLFGSAIFLGVLAFSGAGHASFIVALFCVAGAYSLQGMHAAGSSINVIDLSPSHCGALYGVTNSIGSLPG